MSLSLNAGSLPGIIAREAIGPYVIDAASFVEDQLDDDGGVLGKLWNLAKGVTGFLWKAAVSILGGVGFTFTRLWGLIVNSVQFVVNFDFGATDAALDAAAKGQWEAIAAQFGGVAGNAAGWLVGGVLPGALLFQFNEVAAIAVLREVGEEALEELSAGVFALTQSLLRIAVRTAFVRSFKAFRKWLKKPGNLFAGLLPASLREAWATGKSWRIATEIEKKVESIQNPVTQNFIEEFLEEFSDAVIEAGYVVAGGLDRYVAEQRRSTVNQYLEVTPNREYPNEKFLLAGPEDQLRTTVPQLLATHELIDHRDIGIVSAVDPTQLITQAQPLELYCRIEWRSPLGNQGPRPSYQISSVKRSKLGDYDFIRQVAGGSNGYQWGRYKAVASMSDGHFITCYGGTEEGAEERAIAMATLSDANIQVINVTEEKRSASRLTIKGLRKESTQVQPYRIVITNRKYYTEPHPGSRASKRGYFLPISAALSIRSPTKPPGWDEKIAQLLAGPTVSNPG